MKRFYIGFFFFLSMSYSYAKPVEIVFWHAMTGHLGVVLQQLVDQFNESQTHYHIKTVYKGEYHDLLTSFGAAFQAKKPPAMVQIFEVGTQVMLSPKGIIVPTEQLLQEHHIALPKQDFFPAIEAYYSRDGQLQALPLNISIPVMYYNAQRLAQVGYSGEQFPKTWQQFEDMAKKLQKLGQSCVYTMAFPSWMHLESFSALHHLHLLKSQQAAYDNPAVLHHLERLRRWHVQHLLSYGGRANHATVLFTSGHCAVFSQSSGSFQSLAQMVAFPLGVAPMPHDADVVDVRYANAAGGAALWAVTGHSKAVYAGIAAFYHYLMTPAVQQAWHQKTGYLPLGGTGIYQSIPKQGNRQVLKIAQQDLSKHLEQNAYATGPMNLLRMINDEAMEAIFSDQQSPQQALQDAVLRANYAIKRFQNNTG